MQQYVVGMDGGGTKTKIEVRSLDNQVIAHANFSAMNLNGEKRETVEKTFRDFFAYIDTLPGGLGGMAALCIGSAGISNPVAAETLTDHVRRSGYTGRLQLVGDQEIALYGALGEPCGIILIAGTGSICYGRNAAGQSARSGGWGYLIDDGGSGYAIGRDILSAVVQAQDGRIPPTVLTELVYQTLNLKDIQSLIRFVYHPATGKQDISSLAVLLGDALAQEDAAALHIAERAARDLSSLVSPVAKKLSLQAGKLAFLGSVLTQNQTIAAAVQSRCMAALPELTLISPKDDAAAGAAQMALHMAVSSGLEQED